MQLYVTLTIIKLGTPEKASIPPWLLLPNGGFYTHTYTRTHINTYTVLYGENELRYRKMLKVGFVQIG